MSESGYLAGRYITVPRVYVEALESLAAAAWWRLEHEHRHKNCPGPECDDWVNAEADVQEALKESGVVPHSVSAFDQRDQLREAFNAMRYAATKVAQAHEVDPDGFRDLARAIGEAKTQVHSAMQREDGRIAKLYATEGRSPDEQEILDHMFSDSSKEYS